MILTIHQGIGYYSGAVMNLGFCWDSGINLIALFVITNPKTRILELVGV